MTIQFSGSQGQRIREAVAQIKNHADSTLRQQLSSAVGQHAGLPRQLTEFLGALSDLEDALAGGAAAIPDALAPVLATVAAYYRRTFATDLEERRARALAGELLQNLDAAKASLDALLTSEWYLATTPLRLPRLRDFVAESRLVAPADRPKPPPRHLDDKFGVLWSASDLLRDLGLVREECGERFAPVAVGFADVDGLKALNSALGETWVDALILPPLMRSVERAVFGHGYAYRYGGDEFVLLIPSADRDVVARDSAPAARRPRGHDLRERAETADRLDRPVRAASRLAAHRSGGAPLGRPGQARGEDRPQCHRRRRRKPGNR